MTSIFHFVFLLQRTAGAGELNRLTTFVTSVELMYLFNSP